MENEKRPRSPSRDGNSNGKAKKIEKPTNPKDHEYVGNSGAPLLYEGGVLSKGLAHLEAADPALKGLIPEPGDQAKLVSRPPKQHAAFIFLSENIIRR